MKTRIYIVLLFCLLSIPLAAQLRFQMAERWEFRLQELNDRFTTRDVDGSTDRFQGLHTGQYSGTHHLFGLSAEGGWSSHLTTMPHVKNTPGGGSIGLHLLYEYQYSGLLVQTGLGVVYQNCTNAISDTSIYHEHMHDKWQGVDDVEFRLRHDFYDRRDQSQNLYGQVPIYVGGYIIGGWGVGYYLAGLKFNYAFWGNTRVNLTGSTSGQYERYVGEWVEMDNHGFRKDVPIERSGSRLNMKFDVLLHAEMGYEWSSYRGNNYYRNSSLGQLDARYRIGGYIDFGVLNVCPNSDKPFYETPMETIYDFPTYRMYHAFATKDAQSAWMRNIFVGVRLTVLFGLPAQQKCILCDTKHKYQ